MTINTAHLLHKQARDLKIMIFSGHYNGFIINYCEFTVVTRIIMRIVDNRQFHRIIGTFFREILKRIMGE